MGERSVIKYIIMKRLFHLTYLCKIFVIKGRFHENIHIMVHFNRIYILFISRYPKSFFRNLELEGENGPII